MDKTLFLATILINGEDEVDGTDEDEDTDKDEYGQTSIRR